MASLFETVTAAGKDIATASGRVDVWLLPSDVDLYERDEFWQLLSETEKERARRFKFDRDRDRFITAHGALRLILGAYCAHSAKELDFSAGPQGKPALADPAARIAFNLSHSGGFTLIAVTAGSACGVDIEEIRSGVSTIEIAQRFFTEDENRWLNSLPPDQRSKGFFRLWAVKEAVIKATGKGLSTPLKDVDAVQVLQKGAATVTVTSRATDIALWVSELDLAGGFAAAVAVEGGEHVIRIIHTAASSDLQ